MTDKLPHEDDYPFWYVLDDDGRPIPCHDRDVVEAFIISDRRRVALDTFADGAVEVSTVFLVHDHAFGGGPPVLWETLVFGGPLDGACDRYTSREAAVAGHAVMCARVVADLGL
jgi:hypothetical protein